MNRDRHVALEHEHELCKSAQWKSKADKRPYVPAHGPIARRCASLLVEVGTITLIAERMQMHGNFGVGSLRQGVICAKYRRHAPKNKRKMFM